MRARLKKAELLVASGLPARGPSASSVIAQQVPSGRVLASTRGQVAWLDLLAPRPTLLTQLVRPAYPADVAADSHLFFAVASVVSAFAIGQAMGGDLLIIDLQSGISRTLQSRKGEGESLDMPAIWPDGSGIVYQRTNLRAAVPMPGQAQPQYQSRIEQVAPDGSGAVVLVDDARYPGPAPDGACIAFVRSTARGSGIFSHSLVDGSEQELIPPGQFLALAYPRFSPDGKKLAFVAISLIAPIGEAPSIFEAFSPPLARAHGFPWEAWLVNADGSGLRQLPDVIDDDPSVAWSPDGTQLLVYGGWGSYLVDAASGATTSLPYLVGYGSVAWITSLTFHLWIAKAFRSGGNRYIA